MSPTQGSRRGETGKRTGLKSLYPQGFVSSSLTVCTKNTDLKSAEIVFHRWGSR